MGNGVLHVYYKYDMCKCNVNPIRSQLEVDGKIDRFHFNSLFHFPSEAHVNAAYIRNKFYVMERH